MNRKERRRMEKSMGTESTEKLAEKIFQFNQLPEACNACTKTFNKKDKDMVQSWSVVVRQEVVRLFCPACIQKTKERIEDVNSSKNRQEKSNDDS
jgi:ribosomal protein L44E